MDSTTPLTIQHDGSKTVAEIVHTMHEESLAARKLGKSYIVDHVARMRQIAKLKPGSVSIRTPEMIDEIIDRLLHGESYSAIACHDHMPALSTMFKWMKEDPAFESECKWAKAMAQHALKDLTMDIAAGGMFSTGDARRDELLVKVIDRNASQRNRAEFGEHRQIDLTTTTPTVMLAPIPGVTDDLEAIDAEYSIRADDGGDGD